MDILAVGGVEEIASPIVPAVDGAEHDGGVGFELFDVGGCGGVGGVGEPLDFEPGDFFGGGAGDDVAEGGEAVAEFSVGSGGEWLVEGFAEIALA